MITVHNAPEVFKDINGAEFIDEFNKPHDYMLIWLHIFNVGGFVSFKSADYCPKIEEEASSKGQLFADKDSIALLIKEYRPDLYDEL